MHYNFLSDIPFKADLYASNPDKIKFSEFAVLACLFIATKFNASPDDLRSYLSSKNVKKEAIDELVSVYRLNRDELTAKAMTFAPVVVPHLTNVNWSLLCNVTNTGGLSEAGELTYKIQLDGVPSTIDGSSGMSFLCSVEELQALINRLKEIERHCNKIA